MSTIQKVCSYAAQIGNNVAYVQGRVNARPFLFHNTDMRKADIDFLWNAVVVILLIFMNFNPRYKRVKYLPSKSCNMGVLLASKMNLDVLAVWLFNSEIELFNSEISALSLFCSSV